MGHHGGVPAKKPKGPGFDYLVAKAREGGSRHPKDGQAANRVTDEGAWDADGAYWPTSNEPLKRRQVEALLDEPDVRVGVHGGYSRPVRFFGVGEARRIWGEEIREHFADEGDLEAGGWPDDVAYVAELRRRPDGARMLWFGGNC